MTSVPDIFHKRWGHLYEHCMLTGKENNRGDMYRPRSLTPSCLSIAADQLVGKQTEALWQNQWATCSTCKYLDGREYCTISYFTDDLTCLFKTNDQIHGVGFQSNSLNDRKQHYILILVQTINYALGDLFFLTLRLVTVLDQKCILMVSYLSVWTRGLWSLRVPHKWCFKGAPNFSWGRRSWINREKSHQRTIQLHWNSSHSFLKERVKCLDLAGAVFYKLQSHCFLRERVWHLKVSIVQSPDIPCWAFFSFPSFCSLLACGYFNSQLNWLTSRRCNAISVCFRHWKPQQGSLCTCLTSFQGTDCFP